LALLMLATSRWGAYLVPGPPFLVDIVLALLLAERGFAAATGRLAYRGVDSWVALPASLLIAFSALALGFSSLDLDAFRDAAPYLYVILVFLAAPLGGRAINGAITFALVFHAGWVTAAELAGGALPFTPVLSGGAAEVFQLRPDVDSAVCGLLAVISLHRALLGRTPIVNLVLAGWGTALVFMIYTRAGLLAFAAQLIVAVAVSPARRHILESIRPDGTRTGARVVRSLHRRRMAVVATLILILPIAAIPAAEAEPVKRLKVLLELQDPASSPGLEGEAVGTAGARVSAWGRLVEWMTGEPARTIGGVGFGQDYLRDSGAARLLLGPNPPPEAESRHPHSYFLNTWARLGIVGVILTVVLLGAALRLGALLVRKAPTLEEVDVLAISIVASFPVAGAFGVILEAPFGAVPYFWAIGFLSVRACELGLAAPLGVLVKPGWRPRPRIPPGAATSASPEAPGSSERTTCFSRSP
jgi:hypothetical protein